MLSEKRKLQINTLISDEQHLVRLTQFWPDGHLINQMAHALMERNAELLLLREQLETINENLHRPIAEVVSKFGDPESFGEREIKVLVDLSAIPYDTKLYANTEREGN
ncbi:MULTISPECIES: hypothetical protein [Yersinia]|uniref:Transposase n=1 Tax=Yersinia kristensenii TaxID=28152 RepID=A0AB73NQW0_YERKR|nr:MULTISPECIES: hypothetical protein [Yersinia]OVZ75356.1 hypothetical protein CBW52_22385 [Yersinia kristensenii]BCU90667.1 hypothetical protein YP72344_21620 [Yersinia pseudotuberculosis]